MKVLDFEVIVDLEHQDLANRVNPFEDGKVPTSVKYATNFPNEARDVRVGLGEDANCSVLSSGTCQFINFIGSAKESLWFRDQGHDLRNTAGGFQIHQRNRQFLETT